MFSTSHFTFIFHMFILKVKWKSKSLVGRWSHVCVLLLSLSRQMTLGRLPNLLASVDSSVKWRHGDSKDLFSRVLNINSLNFGSLLFTFSLSSLLRHSSCLTPPFSFLHSSFSKYFWNVCYVPGALIGPGSREKGPQHPFPLHSFSLSCLLGTAPSAFPGSQAS